MTPAEIDGLWEEAKAHWQLSLSRASFDEAIERAMARRGKLSQGEVRELYLACACADGSEQAIERFDRDYIATIPMKLARMQLSPADMDEVQQLLRQRLLVGDHGRSKMREYAGGGSLMGLVRVAASRIAIDLLRRQKREVFDPSDDLLGLPEQADDPELQAIKEQHRSEFRLAFEEALQSLSNRQRTLLRLHFLDGVPLQQLATSYRVHRATIVRWLAAARADLLSHTRKRLGERLGLDKEALTSFVRLIESRFDVSLRRILDEQ